MRNKKLNVIVNTGALQGCFWNSRDKRWTAHVNINGKQTHLGNYHTEKEAHAVYCEAAKKVYGEFFNPG